MWAFVGCYSGDGADGGITVFRVDPEAGTLARTGVADRALEAGYLTWSPSTRTLYSVDERKTDGRGPVGPAAAVHAFAFDAAAGGLSWRNSHPAPGPFPTYLSLDEARRKLYCANHGSFDHVERVVRTPDGGWTSEYLYDASTVIAFDLLPDGAIGGIADLMVLDGHGRDPNGSPQAGGHAQSGPHAHSAALDPSGMFVVVCDKGTDQVLTYRSGAGMELVSVYRFPEETAPRHVAFAPGGDMAFVTLEIDSGLAAMRFDAATGALGLIDRVAATAPGLARLNEPAEVRVHPNGRFVYVNNRGEDSLAWFEVAAKGRLRRLGHVAVAPSVHPGLAARSFSFDPGGRAILFADRPANLIRLYAVNAETGEPAEIASAAVTAPAFVAFADGRSGDR